jgi:hypothetical protein
MRQRGRAGFSVASRKPIREEMPSIRRRYLVALALAALAAVAWVVVPQVVDSVRSQHRKAELAAALRGLRRLQVPSNFVRLTSNCDWYRCYHILRQPTPAAARPIVREILASTGATPIRTDVPTPIGTGAVCGAHASVYGPLTLCTDPGVLHGHVIIVFLKFYEPFRDNHYVLPPRGSEVDVSFDCGAGAGSPQVTATDVNTVCPY